MEGPLHVAWIDKKKGEGLNMGKCCYYIILCTINTLPVNLNMIIEIFVDVIPTVYSGPHGPLLNWTWTCEGSLVQYFAEPGLDLGQTQSCRS